MPDNKTLLLIGVGVAGYFIWKHMQTQASTATALPAPSPNGTPTATPGVFPLPSMTTPAGTIVNPAQILPVPASPVMIQPSQVFTLPAGITQDMYTTVMNWAQTDGRAPVLQMAAAMVPSEYAGMYDLITNFWDKGISPGSNPAYQPEVDFWNNLRAKYDPQHIVW